MSQTSPTLQLIERAELIKQGAEARVYKLPVYFPEPSIRWPSKLRKLAEETPQASSSTQSSSPTPLLLKHRFPKTYRHPHLDSLLTRQRIQSESRSLLRCLKAGITVPLLRMVDVEAGMVGMEWIDGWSVREVLGGGAEGEEADPELEDEGEVDEEKARRRKEAEGALASLGITIEQLMTSIGKTLSTLHLAQIIHGDLTTSNMMLRPAPTRSAGYEIVLIDFGLSSHSNVPENLAVDLYVLERAFASTHPTSERWYQGVLDAYAKGLGEKKWALVGGRLDEVRLRGRKRDMIG
ncbi:hypothetical protein FFLO_04235 [Filobasidium floriforme]|uniref:EKC/KEOPS complex subunit BUD32 n=1 Tax=Filobasidium floriforme TaxID=5210 RepID=A0A8K0JJL7_9TREE|nr:hypothetical protein FFLO_04235 [Filobasidium floriforme]